MTRLQFNPGPIRIVPDAQREVWTRNTYNWRCQHEDGRGQCTSRDTRTLWNVAERRSEAFCEKHMPKKSASTAPVWQVRAAEASEKGV